MTVATVERRKLTRGRRCQVCAHPALAGIDRELVAGVKPSALARRHGLNLRAVQRHRERHVPAALARGAEACEAARARDLRARVEAIVADLERRAAEAGDGDEYLRVVDRLVKALELWGRSTGELASGSQVVVNNVLAQLGPGVTLERAREAIEVVTQAEALDVHEIAQRAADTLLEYRREWPAKYAQVMQRLQ